MGTRTFKKYIIIVFATLVLFLFIYNYRDSNCFKSVVEVTEYVGPQYSYNRSLPLIFIGGMPRSGTTLLRVMLDAHPDIRCGEETRIVPRILGLRQQWLKTGLEAERLKEAGIDENVLDSALSAFILEIIVKHGVPAPRLCNKDPFTLRSAVYLNKLFPKSKFIFMIRDGRAVVHSIISRKVTISGFNLNNPRECLIKWNRAMESMNDQCTKLGKSACLPVHYEQLVLNPKLWIGKILSFLEVPWHDSVLNHEKFVNKPGGISLSKLERSTDQVIKPINIEALSKWVGSYSTDVVRDMPSIAPMLSELGYDPRANPPDYGKPDKYVIKNMEDLKRNSEEWDKKVKEIIRSREDLKKIFFDASHSEHSTAINVNYINNNSKRVRRQKKLSDKDIIQGFDSYRKVSEQNTS